ncbi:MAG: hypothetical protein QW369_04945 [Desulfurococcaceae archaeon]
MPYSKGFGHSCESAAAVEPVTRGDEKMELIAWIAYALACSNRG